MRGKTNKLMRSLGSHEKLIAICFQLLFRFPSQMFPSQLRWLRSDRLELESCRFKIAAWTLSSSLTSFIVPGPPVRKAEPSDAIARALTPASSNYSNQLGEKTLSLARSALTPQRCELCTREETHEGNGLPPSKHQGHYSRLHERSKKLSDSSRPSAASSLIHSEHAWKMISIASTPGDDKGERTIWLQDNGTLTQVFFTSYTLLLAQISTASGIQDKIARIFFFFLLCERVNSAEILFDKASYCETHNVCIVRTDLLQG